MARSSSFVRRRLVLLAAASAPLWGTPAAAAQAGAGQASVDQATHSHLEAEASEQDSEGEGPPQVDAVVEETIESGANITLEADSNTEVDVDTKTPAETLTNPCQSVEQPPSQWLDRVQLGVFNAVCGSAFWFDQFFGSSHEIAGEQTTHGRLSMNFQYDSIRELEPKLRMRARVSLPRFENRLQAMVGRTDEDELLRDELTEFNNLTPSLRDSDDEWLLGLGYSPFRGSKRRLDFTGGVNLRFPLDPFVAARFRRHFVLGESTLMRARQTVFWRHEKGTGVSSRVDVDRAWGANHLIRWTTGATHAEETLGIDWHTSLTFFQNLRDGEAVAYQASWLGESDAPVAIEEFGIQAIYRKRTFRDWFFLQVSPGVIWRRESLNEPRQAVPVIGFGFEMLFGDLPGKTRATRSPGAKTDPGNRIGASEAESTVNPP